VKILAERAHNGEQSPLTGVERITLTHYRNYANLRLETDLLPVVLTGANGAGKTNLLEAISFLAPGRGMRNARLSEVTMRCGPDLISAENKSPYGWAVAASVIKANGVIELGTGLNGNNGDRRVVRVDGQNARGQNALASEMGILWITPAMDRLFVEGSSARRRFLDRMIIALDPDHAGRTAAYYQAIRQRRRLLEDGPHDDTWLHSLEDTMVRYGVSIAAARRDIVKCLNSEVAVSASIFPSAILALDGVVEGWLDDMPAVDAEDALRELLIHHRELAADSRETVVGVDGPHRTDLKVHMASTGKAANECSTGEQKAILISMILAQARLQTVRRGLLPVLLLDEITAHLDDSRREALFEELVAIQCQAWITGTDRALFDSLRGRAQYFTVESGTITAD